MATVLLTGPFGQANPGVEAILDAFIVALPEWDVVATSADPEATSRDHGIGTLPPARAGKPARAAKRADALVLTGAPLLPVRDAPGNRNGGYRSVVHRPMLAALGALARGKPVAAIGIGAAEFGTGMDRVLARAVIARAGLVVLRDEASAELLTRVGSSPPFRIGADPAWTLLGPAEQQSGSEPEHDDAIAVVLNHHAGRNGLVETLVDGLRPLARTDMRIVLVPWEAGTAAFDDVSLARSIAARLPDVEIAPAPPDLLSARAFLGRHRVVVGMRFHALAAAASAGVPFVALAHSPDVRALAERLGQPCVALEEGGAALAWTISDALLDGMPATSAAVREQITAAEEGFRLLRILLAHGESDEVDQITGLTLAPEGWAT